MATVKKAKRSFYIPHLRHMLATGEGETRQEFRDECDVNVLMARYQKTGVMPGGDRVPQYGDFAEVPDFMTAMNVVLAANEAFMSLPAKVRKEFDNDPAAFVDFAQDPDNIERLREWGLAPPVVEEVIPRVRIVPEAGDGLQPERKPAETTQ